LNGVWVGGVGGKTPFRQSFIPIYFAEKKSGRAPFIARPIRAAYRIFGICSTNSLRFWDAERELCPKTIIDDGRGRMHLFSLSDTTKGSVSLLNCVCHGSAFIFFFNFFLSFRGGSGFSGQGASFRAGPFVGPHLGRARIEDIAYSTLFRKDWVATGKRSKTRGPVC